MTQTTDAQHGIWLTERAGGAGASYHMALGIRFDGPLDAAALVAACDAVLARHVPLRSAVVEVDGATALVPSPVPPRVHRTVLGETTVADAVAAPFDLARGPLVRITLAADGPERHLLLFVAHHLVFDGMSKDILVRDLARAYSGVALPPEPGAASHAADERVRVAADLEAARRFWAPRWRDPTDLVLPELHHQPVGAEPGAEVTFTLDPALTEAVDRGVRKLGVTRFELFVAAFHAVLRRYGNTDLPVAVDVSTRTPGVAGAIGHFVNELPVTVTAPADVTFADLATAVRAELRAAYRYRAVPVPHAVGRVRPRAALTPVSVSYRRRGPDPEFAGLRTTVHWTMFSGSARNALHLQLVDAPDAVEVSLRHSPAAIPTTAVERIGAHLRTLLDAAVREPDAAVAELPMLPPHELDLVLRRWNTTARPYPSDATLGSLFAARVAAAPHAVAAECAGRRLTYTDLDAASGRLAARLRAGGAGPGTLVAVCLDRSLDLLVALLAVARTGAGYVPVDPAYPPARRDHIIRDAAPAVVLTDVDGPGTETTPVPADDRPDGTAYVLYTSGSTGRPKGVDVPHAQLANLLLALRDLLDAGPDDVWLAHTSASFDICAAELFLPLVTGGRTVIATDREARDPAGLVRLIHDSGVTHVQATPSGWQMLLDGGFGATGREPVVAVSGGEVLPPTLAARLRARVRRLWNGYGPTEATVYTTMADVPEPVDVVTIGRPVANCTLYVLDDARRPVPLGVPGELWVGGAGVARGYLGRPDLTAERFVADPWTPGGRLYRTGDRVRYRADGSVLFLGRTDNQVKIRGHRVELGEIEATLLEHPQVAQAAVRYCADDDPWLMGYVVPSGPPPDPASLRAHLAVSLPPAMVPAEWMVLDRFPVNANGKLDRAALPAPVRRPDRPDEPAAPRATDGVTDGVTDTVRAIWCEVLRLDDVGDDEDLFDLGGHSLSITRMMTRIQMQLGADVPLDVFYDTPTVAEIAEYIRTECAGSLVTADREAVR
ncbi:non-ribosomal peptide synthetase [Virgisporangium ochraceum]|uniref:Carrier domain-containing protein n=1 Tax=Virgisporangium ochraceum TaxID=65505 RepID=A0A8J3ZY84_9ACTN|nr:non-ribosomal peptide synthetase [Virgisporangium ochraceum]GIJ70418.1 hypothetical protein Voc01_053350 [Virgisporangium ochraceum]